MNNFVYVIESPSSQDLLDGRTEGQSLCQALTLAEIPYWYSLVTDRESLGQALGPRLVEAWKTLDGQTPIFHLSMHGNQEGIALTHRDDFLSWHDLRQALLPLNRALEGDLLICMSSCFGASGCQMAMYEDEEPFFWALVGNSTSATWADSAVGYITFYHLFFKGIPIERCVAAMKEASGDGNFEWIPGQTAKAIGDNILQQAVDGLSRRIEEAANRAQREIEHSGRVTPNRGLKRTADAARLGQATLGGYRVAVTNIGRKGAMAIHILEHLFLVGEFPERARLLSGLTLEQVTLCPDGASHSIYEELWHVVAYQQSIIEPGDPAGDVYPSAAPEHEHQWHDLVRVFLDGARAAAALGQTPERLAREVEPGVTLADELNSVAVHNAYHLGKIVALRQRIGAWPPRAASDEV